MRAVPVFFIVTAGLVAGSGLAKAEDPLNATRHVIEAQIKAFQAGDAATAYDFAAPAIRSKFPSQAVFMDMVRKQYQPVYDPQSYSFGRSKTIGDGETVLQELMISGRDGKNWRAFYKLLRQPDGSYKINGVAVVPDMISKDI